jgi:transposase
MTIYVGIDLHRKRSQIAALDERGTELLSRRVANEPEALKAILAELGGELQVALEATYGWEWLADLLEGEGHELHLSHPLRTKAIAAARVKTDTVRCAHARAPAAHGSLAGGVCRSTRAARSA